jgi:hypothetical protein
MRILSTILLFLLISKHLEVDAQQVDDELVAEAWLCNEYLKPLSDNQMKDHLTLGSNIRICIHPTFRTRNRRIVMRSIDRFSFSKGERGVDGVQVVIDDGAVVSPDEARISCQPGATVCSFRTILMDELFYPPVFNGNALPPSNTVVQGIGAVTMEFGDGGDRRLLRGTVHLNVSRRTQIGSLAGTSEVKVMDIPIAEQVRGEAKEEEDEGFQEMWEGLPRWGQALCVIAVLLFLFLCCCCCAAFGCWMAGAEIGSKKKGTKPEGTKPAGTSGRTKNHDVSEGDDQQDTSVASISQRSYTSRGTSKGNRSSNSNSRNNSRKPKRPLVTARRPSDVSSATFSHPESEEFYQTGRLHPSSKSIGSPATNTDSKRSRSMRPSLAGPNQARAPDAALPPPGRQQQLGRHSTHGNIDGGAKTRELSRPPHEITPFAEDDVRRLASQTRDPLRHSVHGDAGRKKPYASLPPPGRQSWWPRGKISADGNIDARQTRDPLRHSVHGDAGRKKPYASLPPPGRQQQLARQTRDPLRHSVHGDVGRKNSYAGIPPPGRQQQELARQTRDPLRHSVHGDVGRKNPYAGIPPPGRQQQELARQTRDPLRHSVHGDVGRKNPYAGIPPPGRQQQLARQTRDPLRHSVHGDVGRKNPYAALPPPGRQQQLGSQHSAHGNVDPGTTNARKTTRGPLRRPSLQCRMAPIRQNSDLSSTSSASFAEDDDYEPRQSMPSVRIPVQRNSVNGNVAAQNPPPRRHISDIDDDDEVSAANSKSYSVVSTSSRATPQKHHPKRLSSNATASESGSVSSAASKRPPRKSPPKKRLSSASASGSVRSSASKASTNGASESATTRSVISASETVPKKHPPKKRLSSKKVTPEAESGSVTSASKTTVPKKPAPTKKHAPKKKLSSKVAAAAAAAESGSGSVASASKTAAVPKKHPPTKKLATGGKS